MIHDIRLHGQIGDKIEFYATIAGEKIDHRYFYNSSIEKEGHIDRFFAPGNEFVMGEEGISFNSNGGSVCEYMFGVEQPYNDLVKKDVINRMAMFGTYFDEEEGNLVFTNTKSGFDSYEKIFLDMHAVFNYFFFIQLNGKKDTKKQQEMILKAIGKGIKRNLNVGIQHDTELARAILADLNMPDTILFLFRLVNVPNRSYYKMFKRFYEGKKSISEEESTELRNLADMYGIDQYQQERIKIDVMYKHPDNRKIIDEYKDILISTEQKEGKEGKALANPKLTRLRTLSVRNNIPLNLFDTLDNLILKGKKIVTTDEPDYIMQTREILEGLFLLKHGDNELINTEDMIKLLKAKKTSAEMRDRNFETILLDTGRICDEKMKEDSDTTAFENFGYIVTYFDRYDATSAIISQLSFMERIDISEDQLRSLLGNKKEFDTLKKGLFRELFFDPILNNRYLAYYGRKKINILLEGLEAIEKGNATLQKVQEEVREVGHEEELYYLIHRNIKDRIKTFYSELNTKDEQAVLKREVSKELVSKGLIEGEIPDHIFSNGIMNIKKEAIYLHNLLPQIINTKDSSLREDFLINSGLDRFYIEELEKEYFRVNAINEEELNKIRRLAA